MMTDRLRSDAAWACAQALLETVAPALRPEAQPVFFDKAFRACKAMIESYDIMRARERNQCVPSDN